MKKNEQAKETEMNDRPIINENFGFYYILKNILLSLHTTYIVILYPDIIITIYT